jgi:hypothetical protein
MQNYETPELTLVGQTEEVVMGLVGSGFDFPYQAGMDFEFEQD